MQTFKTRLLAESCYQACLKCSDADFKIAGIVGGTTTEELRHLMRRMGRDPKVIVAAVNRMRARCAEAVDHADFLKANLRKTRPGFIPNVEVERRWLAIADELIERAESAVELWRLTGGPRELEAAGASSQSGASGLPSVIEIFPTFNIEVTAPAVDRPMDVRVVSMPTRESVTELDRDDDDAIIGAKRIERDVA